MSAAAETPSGRTSLAEHAYEVLRHRLIMLDTAPGDPINEASLSAELGIGRTPIREALKRLEGEHLVVSYPRRGTFASSVDITDLAAITEMREALEPIAA
ncbi:MAG TPA: GntR family transcriptional regulator, partial [Candidatus Brevibacterium intestinigallinarum]|nr:GntR family transcriptional regulator [Candidatus Brevibacterium intestinigallinarum]